MGALSNHRVRNGYLKSSKLRVGIHESINALLASCHIEHSRRTDPWSTYVNEQVRLPVDVTTAIGLVLDALAVPLIHLTPSAEA